MCRPKLLHPVTADHRREIDIRALTKVGAFRQPMRFPFQHLVAADHRRAMATNDVRAETVFHLSKMQRKARFALSRQPVLLLSDMR